MPRRGTKYPKPFLTIKLFSEQELASLRAGTSGPNENTWLPVFHLGQQVTSTLVPTRVIPWVAMFQPFQLLTRVIARPPTCQLYTMDSFTKELWNTLRRKRLETEIDTKQPVSIRLQRVVMFFLRLTSEPGADRKLGLLGLPTVESLASKPLSSIFDANYIGTPRLLSLEPDHQALILDQIWLQPPIIFANGNVLDCREENLISQATSKGPKYVGSSYQIRMNRIAEASVALGSNANDLPISESFEEAINNQDHTIEPIQPTPLQDTNQKFDGQDAKVDELFGVLHAATRIAKEQEAAKPAEIIIQPPPTIIPDLDTPGAVQVTTPIDNSIPMLSKDEEE